MGQQQISGAFLSHGPGIGGVSGANVNIQDTGVSAVSGWTDGATNLTPLPIQAPLGDVWTIVSWQITFNGIIQYLATPAYGRLGKLIGGIIPGSQSVGGPSIPWTNPMVPLPTYGASLAVIYDPASDVPYPAALPLAHTTVQPLFPIVHTETPATPLALQSGQTATIGLWLEPALVANAQTYIINASYIVVWDDGQPAVHGWGGP
jgi:hypothetical protein